MSAKMGDKILKKNDKYRVYYSLSGLEKVKRLYVKNWDKYKKLDFKSDELRLVENELNKLEKSIRQELGLTGFQCPANISKDCSDCKGYYWVHKVGYVCPLYDYSSNGTKKDIFNSLADALRKPALAPGCTYDAQGWVDGGDSVIPKYQYTRNNR